MPTKGPSALLGQGLARRHQGRCRGDRRHRLEAALRDVREAFGRWQGIGCFSGWGGGGGEAKCCTDVDRCFGRCFNKHFCSTFAPKRLELLTSKLRQHMATIPSSFGCACIVGTTLVVDGCRVSLFWWASISGGPSGEISASTVSTSLLAMALAMPPPSLDMRPLAPMRRPRRSPATKSSSSTT